MPAFLMWLMMHGCGNSNASARGRQGPWQGPPPYSSPVLPLRAAALLCYQHRSWEPVRRPTVSASSWFVNWGDSIIHVTTISSDTGPPRMWSRIVVEFINAHTHTFSGHVHKCISGLNFTDEIQFAKSAKFYTPENSYPYGKFSVHYLHVEHGKMFP